MGIKKGKIGIMEGKMSIMEEKERSYLNRDPDCGGDYLREDHYKPENGRLSQWCTSLAQELQDNKKASAHKSTEAGREKKKSTKNKGHILGMCMMFAFITMVSLAGLFRFTVGAFSNRMQDAGFRKTDIVYNSDMAADTWKHMENYRNILLFGVDSRDQDPLKKGALADVCLLVSIHKSTGKISLLSLYRDTLVEDMDGNFKKLTEVYSSSGPQGMIQTINKQYDLNINEYVTVTWASVANFIDSLGGVDVLVNKKEAHETNRCIGDTMKNTGIETEYLDENISEDGEVYHLDGVQAVTYCRIRKGVGDEQGRTNRQRKVIKQALSVAKRHPKKAVSAAYNIMPEIASNLSAEDIISLVLGLPRYHMEAVGAYPFSYTNLKWDNMECILSNTLFSNNERLHQTLFDNAEYEPSDTVQGVYDRMRAKFGD